MCGIAGYCEPARSAGPAEMEETALRMAAALRHRGPDDEGAWADADAAVAMSHRRLAILDLSCEGRQPMHSADGRYVLVFNGEIYNFKALRSELEQAGHFFRGHSDTEVMLAGFCQWGLESALERFAGMFAFALWDRQERILHLVRDRAGEKPLYYGWSDGVFLFGSELKALRVHPRWQGRIQREALALLLRYNCIPAPLSIYQGIFKLPPGCRLAVTERDLAAQQTPQPEPYWSLATVAKAGLARPFDGGKLEAMAELKRRLGEAVGQQMVADVPLGAFLSGGVDSSMVVALMQAQSRRPVQTFSIGFEDPKLNEAPFAKAVARHLRTDHTELYVQAGELQQVIPQLPVIYDEPFADTSQIPTVLLCQLARRQVTVCLSGDAGDELFGGYERYPKAQGLWSWLGLVPRPLRQQAATQLQRLCGLGLGLERRPGHLTHLFGRMWNLSELLPVSSDQALYQLLMSTGRNPLTWLKEGAEVPTQFEAGTEWQRFPTLLLRMMYSDFAGYLPEDILVKVDRAAMSVSLETRMPFLDHRFVEFAWSLPAALKQRAGQGKWLLRQVLYQYVPPALVERPKMGFAVPLAEWLRGPLRPWAAELLDPARLRQEGFLEETTIHQRWTEHLDRRRDWGPPLWNVLMFQAWLEEQKTAHPMAGLLRPGFAPGDGVGPTEVCQR